MYYRCNVAFRCNSLSNEQFWLVDRYRFLFSNTHFDSADTQQTVEKEKKKFEIRNRQNSDTICKFMNNIRIDNVCCLIRIAINIIDIWNRVIRNSLCDAVASCFIIFYNLSNLSVHDTQKKESFGYITPLNVVSMCREAWSWSRFLMCV